MKKIIKKTTKKVANYCPPILQNAIVRNCISLPDIIPENLVFKIAETEEELEASFKLVYESYVKLGYCEENSHNLRATLHHALPSTTTLIAKDGARVVGTLTIVRDSPFKLPLEKHFNINVLKKNAKRTAEITSLVIHPDYRREKGGSVLFTLLRYMYEYSTNYFGVNHLVVSIHPKEKFFYKSLMLFEDIPHTREIEYMGAPAICLQLDLEKASERYRKTYDKKRPEKNLYHFFKQKKITNLKYPDRKFHKINDPLVSTRFYEELFLKKLKIEMLSHQQTDLRKDQRVDVECHSVLSLDDITFDHAGKIKDVSSRGFRFYSDQLIPKGSECVCRIKVGPKHYSEVRAKSVWSNRDKGVGFKILESDENWNYFIKYLKEDLEGKVA